MNNKPSFVPRNFSAIVFVIAYIAMAVIHIVSDTFLLSDQLGLFIVMLPFFLTVLALDFVLSRNKTMKAFPRIIVQFLPLGIFVMWLFRTVFISFSQQVFGKYVRVIDYLIWFFIAFPFFLAIYQKEGFRRRTLQSIAGTGAFVLVYLYLTTKTHLLDKSYGFFIIILSYFFMLSVASGIRQLPYAGMVLGILNALILLLFYFFPVTNGAKAYGWDYDILFNMDLVMVITFILCILLRIYGIMTAEKKPLR